MIQTIIGTKVDQTQKFLADGTRVPVTQIHVPDNTVVQLKTQDKDKYAAVQIGFGQKKKPTKPALGHAKKSNLNFAPRILKEIRLTNADQPEESENSLKTGLSIRLDAVLKPGDIVDVTGTSKGKGFAGVVKRHNFRGGPKTHGQSDRLRAPGSIGQTTTPGRVYKGKRMAGRMGQDKVTIKNLTIIDIDAQNKILYVSGLIPGAKKSIVYITRTGELKNFTPLFDPKPKETPKEEATPTKQAAPTPTQPSEESKKQAQTPVSQTPPTETKGTKSEEKIKIETPAPEEEKESKKGEKEEKGK
jgi:large subunit ribosomal protein L3